jgi:hypothetical protein
LKESSVSFVSPCLGLVILIAIAPQLLADRILNFPRLSSEENTFTGVAIVNPSTQDALITLTAYGEDGELLTGISNPRQLTIPANQQLA